MMRFQIISLLITVALFSLCKTEDSLVSITSYYDVEVSIPDRIKNLQFCENLHSDEFETNTFYFTPTNEDYSSKIIFYVEGDEYLNISLQQFDVGFEFNGSEFYKIALGGDNNVLIRSPSLIELDSNPTNTNVLKADVPNKIELSFPQVGEVVVLVENRIILAPKVADPNPVNVAYIKFHSSEGSNVTIYYNCVDGDGNMLYRFYNDVNNYVDYEVNGIEMAFVNLSVLISCLIVLITIFVGQNWFR